MKLRIRIDFPEYLTMDAPREDQNCYRELNPWSRLNQALSKPLSPGGGVCADGVASGRGFGSSMINRFARSRGSKIGYLRPVVETDLFTRWESLPVHLAGSVRFEIIILTLSN
jgi:hypothetical protein